MSQPGVLQAVLELSEQRKGMEGRITGRLDRLEVRMDQLESRMDSLEIRMDQLDTKLVILADELLTTKADVKLLQQS